MNLFTLIEHAIKDPFLLPMPIHANTLYVEPDNSWYRVRQFKSSLRAGITPGYSYSPLLYIHLPLPTLTYTYLLFYEPFLTRRWYRGRDRCVGSDKAAFVINKYTIA